MPHNAIGRDIPAAALAAAGKEVFGGALAKVAPGLLPRDGDGWPERGAARPGKLVDSLEEAIKRVGLESGMTISFHHHFREGDGVVNLVLDAAAKLGIKDLSMAPSSLTYCHTPLIEHVRKGVVRRIRTSGLRGTLADAISEGLMDEPVIVHSHGGRARAIESGELPLDVAFIGAPAADLYGNLSGSSGPSACGSLGYAMVDARMARRVVALTDHLVDYPNVPASIPEHLVDWVVPVPSIGDPTGIAVGATRMTQNPRDLLLARLAARAIDSAGVLVEGFSMQFGSGGASLAIMRYLRETMRERKLRASFVLGGITSQGVGLLEEGLVGRLLDVQSFDSEAAASLARNRGHVEIDASEYANPLNAGCAVNRLDFVVLSALEVDTAFNVNVLTGSDGRLRGASGGHSDTAAGARLSIVIGPLVRGRTATVIDRVATVVTPGETVDLVVTDRGIAVNPRRPDLAATLRAANLPVRPIEELAALAESITGRPEPIAFDDRVVALVEYRDGTIIDAVRRVKA